MTSWLSQKRKIDLNSLADEAGLRGASSMRKEDLVAALDKHITTFADKLKSVAAFEGYFEPEQAESDSKTSKSHARRATKGPTTSELLEATDRVSTAIARTPRTVSRAVARVPLPPSPSAVTDLVERQTTAVAERISYYWEEIGATYYAEALRERLSTVAGIQALFILVEAYGLSRVILPFRHALNTPGYKFLTSLPVSLPDFFLMLTSDFWAPTTVWAVTSIILPLVFGWFFNLTLHATKRRTYPVDPLIFSISKAFLAYLVYGQGFTFYGFLSYATILRVNAAIPGNWWGIVLGSGIGGIASVYEAALKK